MSIDLEILMPVHNEEKILPKLIKDIDESILNIKYEVQNVEESRDGINPKIVSEDVNKYPCKESDGMNIILKKYCLETLETELFDNF